MVGAGGLIHYFEQPLREADMFFLVAAELLDLELQLGVVSFGGQPGIAGGLAFFFEQGQEFLGQ